ncbi:hypothetical protein AMTRI_Chr04g180580 [Amborella trichopoda]
MEQNRAGSWRLLSQISQAYVTPFPRLVGCEAYGLITQPWLGTIYYICGSMSSTFRHPDHIMVWYDDLLIFSTRTND